MIRAAILLVLSLLMAQTATFTNPVLRTDFPDPDVLKVGDTYYAYATNANGVHIQAAQSADLVHWKWLGEVLPTLPAWAVQSGSYTWAPDVSQIADDQYLMYFVTRDAAHDTQCIGLATASQPQGPFTAHERPFICQPDQGGSIDPSSFVDDDGTRYVLWKNDGNSEGLLTWIYIQPVTPDGQSLKGEPERLITADQRWEGKLVEAPTLWKQDGRYFLFYSANDYSGAQYAIGYASSDDLLGPYTKPQNQLMKSDSAAKIVGPGGQDMIAVHGQIWLLFHKWEVNGIRSLNLIRLQWKDGLPFVDESADSQPVP